MAKNPLDGIIDTMPVVIRELPGSLLVVHQFSEKAKAEIRAKQGKKAKQAKEARDPIQEFEAAKYRNKDGAECVPVTAIKKAIVDAGTAMSDLKKVALRQAIFVSPTVDRSSDLIPIETPDGSPAIGEMREDAVTIGMGKRGLTYRPEYKEWMLRVTVEFNTRLISKEQLLALMTFAGWGVGICEGRPQKTSALGWGRFRVEAQ